MSEILISGSTAYDTYMHYEGLFAEQLKVQWNNMSLSSNTFEKNHGGTGANIAYNLALLGENPILLSSVGHDYSFDGIMEDKVNLNYIHRDKMEHSANSIIVSDRDDNRMTFFHPWAMKFASESKISHIRETVDIAIISANNPDTMLEHAKHLKEKWVKILVDPAQQITQLSHDDLSELLENWNYLIANTYEFWEIIEKLWLSETELIKSFDWLIVTHGKSWSKLYRKSWPVDIAAIDIERGNIVDTTGAGDAYRAGVLYSMIEWHDIEIWCKLWTVLASYCIQAPWSQYHHFNLGQVMEDMKLNFWVEIDLYDKRKY